MAAKKRKDSSHRSPTITDVARMAGASRTAVSYVLNENGERNTHVSEATRAKVLQAVQELHFRPDALARALSLGQSEEIVLIVDTAISPYGLKFIASLQQQALLYGYTPVMYLSQGFLAEQRKELQEKIFARRPLALLCAPLNFTAEDVARAREMGIKHILFIGFHPEPIEQTYSIVFPSEALGYLAAQHLIARGHHHLALVHPNDPIQEEAFTQRLEGMRAAVAEKKRVSLDILPLDLSLSAALSLVETSLWGPDRPTGIYAFSDEYAAVLLGALTRLGIRVPQEVALVGTDNTPLCEYIWPSLTSMSFDALDLGKRTVELLHTLQQGLPLPEELTRPLVPQLIQREST